MDEKRWMDKIKNSAEDVEIPESLRPENIEQKLQNVKVKKKKSPIMTFSRRMGAVAAAVLAFALTWQGAKIQKAGKGLESVSVNQEGTAFKSESEANTEKRHEETAPEEQQVSGESVDQGAAAALEDQASVAEIEPALKDQENTEEIESVLEDRTSTAEAESAQQETAELTEALTMTGGRKVQAPDTEAATGFKAAGSYKELFEKLADWQRENGYDRGIGGMTDGAMNLSSGAAMVEKTAAAADISMENSMDYSVTNRMEQGVDEGDIVKTDGKNIFILRDGSVLIFQIQEEELEEAAEISFQEMESTDYLKEMYVEGEKLILIAEGVKTRMLKDETGNFVMRNQNYTAAYTYSIEDAENPRLLGTVRVDGTYHTSRKNGDYLYVLTDYFPVIENCEEDSLFIPLANGEELAADDMLIAPKMLTGNSLVAVSIDLANPEEIKDRKALVGISDLIYVSENSIYVTQQDWTANRTSTNIMKFTYKKGMLEGAGAGTVPGYLNDGFSMNEYQGFLRVVSTSWDGVNKNGLYVLDETMNTVGRVENLAEGEEIYSSRFLGDMGYFVTFRNMDPLFSVDLSDPKNPTVLDELKITGFSEYLHFWGENKLLGIGKEADPQDGTITGVKLSMFDISDARDVREEAKLVIEGEWLSCPGVDNYKAILADVRKNLIGLAVENEYRVYSYSEERGFELRMCEELTGNNWEARGVYVKNRFYLADEGHIVDFDMDQDFKKRKELYF